MLKSPARGGGNVRMSWPIEGAGIDEYFINNQDPSMTHQLTHTCRQFLKRGIRLACWRMDPCLVLFVFLCFFFSLFEYEITNPNNNNNNNNHANNEHGRADTGQRNPPLYRLYLTSNEKQNKTKKLFFCFILFLYFFCRVLSAGINRQK